MTTIALVSIIVPVYNVEKYLNKCLDSLVGQTLKEIEIICVDDSSTDGSPLILDEYANRDSRVIVIHQSNQGTAQARNVALAKATGKYVGFADNDDWVELDAFKIVSQIMQDDPELDYVCWGCNLIYDRTAGGRNNPGRNKGLREACRVKFSGKQCATDEIKVHTSVTLWTKLFKLETIRTYGITCSEAISAEDTGFFCKYVAHAKYAYYLKADLYNYYRGRPEAVTYDSMRNKNIPVFSGLRVFEDVYAHYKLHGLLNDSKTFLSHIFIDLYLDDLGREEGYIEVRVEGRRLLEIYDLPNLPGNIIKNIRQGREHEPEGYSFLEKMFSVKNRGLFKVITVLGLEIKIKKWKHW